MNKNVVMVLMFIVMNVSVHASDNEEIQRSLLEIDHANICSKSDYESVVISYKYNSDVAYYCYYHNKIRDNYTEHLEPIDSNSLNQLMVFDISDYTPKKISAQKFNKQKQIAQAFLDRQRWCSFK